MDITLKALALCGCLHKMQFTTFSTKQKKALAWWTEGSRWNDCDAIIADGAVRSGKTLCLSMSFVLWAMSRYNGKNFAICGKTVTACRRNVITPLLQIIKQAFKCQVTESVSQGYFDVSNGKVTNRFFIFGGKDEGSAALIQGVTLAGILMDEVALMPRSFVEQGLARCSVEGSKFWFNCNPESPSHWFYREWIQKQKSKNAYYLHFTMGDNPSMSERMKNRYRSLYSGVFYERYIAGKWVVASGIVYPMFNKQFHMVPVEPRPYEQYQISIDYGTVNPFSAGLWGKANGVWYRVKEYYHDSRVAGKMLTDEEYVDAIEKLVKGLPAKSVLRAIADPSAASFINAMRMRKAITFPTVGAKNDVLNGIRVVSSALRKGLIKFNECCKDTEREFTLYSWDENSVTDAPIKENDHAMDDIRYFTYFNFEWTVSSLPGFSEKK